MNSLPASMLTMCLTSHVQWPLIESGRKNWNKRRVARFTETGARQVFPRQDLKDAPPCARNKISND